jgi:hypothetical protein
MRPQLRSLSAVLISAFALASCCGLPKSHGTAFDGAWRVIAVEVEGSGATKHDQPQPSLVLFSGEYYSWSRVTTTSPRALFVAETPTDAERVAAFDSVLFNAGRYEVSDSTLTVWPIVARSPNFMGGASESYRFRLSGDTLWVEQRSEDVQFRLGDRLVKPSAARVLRLVLQRIP